MKLTGAHLFVFVSIVFATTQPGAAQSGRRKAPAPLPSPSPAHATQTNAQTNRADPLPTPPQPPSFHPKAFIITGKTKTEGFKSYGGDDVGDVADEIKFMFDFQHFPARIVKGGKMTREQAIARAKQEIDSYVLWMEINESSDVVNLRVVISVDRVDYLLLMPRTGEVVRQFTVDPGKIVQINGQGTPLPRRTQGRSRDSGVQLRQCGWEIARVLRNWL
jgi:hypothetical protein